jgi:hypothetical protein
MDATEVYSGMYGRIAINFGSYANSGKKGIGAYISTNVQKTRDGEPLGASAPAAENDFGGAQAPQGQAAPNQGFAQQQAPPTYSQQQQQYQQPPALPQQGQAPQQPQQYDPITGAPVNNGGVYGI